MSKLQDLMDSHNEYLAKQKFLAENSIDPTEKEIADDLYQILSGNKTADSLLNKRKQAELSRWNSYLIKNQITTAMPLVCKGCGYKRYFYKEYGVENHLCPECRKEYALVNDESLYIPNNVSKSERAFSLIIGIPLLVYSIAITYLPSVHLFLVSKHNASIEFSGLSKIPASMALIAITCFVLSFIVDHYDKRHNEIMYKNIRFWTPLMYILFMIIAVGVQIGI